MSTVYELKSKLATVGEQLAAVESEMVSKLANPAVAIEEINDLEQKKADLQKRFDLLKDAHDKAVAEQDARLRRTNPVGTAGNEQERLIAAKAELIRAAVLGRPASDEAMALLHAIPTGNTSGGEKLLPTNMSNELIHEPFATNPLRGIIGMSNVKGLERPKIAYELDDDGFITDVQTAKEIKLTGDKVTFGRNKFKVKARISDTVLHGSDLNLVSYVENALRSGLAAKERKVSFASGAGVPDSEKHMSFYQTGITEVEGGDLYEAITNAIAALHEDFRETARVVMRFADYVKILRTLANNSAALFQAPPEMVIGKPVVFSDAAVQPIVGAFNYAHLNYDGALVYDSDKDVDKGEYLFVLTAWFDQHILLKSAFRRAKVVPVIED